jgi:hypothetical protein
MPAHHPVPPGVYTPLLLPRHERERLVDEVCARLSEGLDSAVANLRELVTQHDATRRWGVHGPRRVES